MAAIMALQLVTSLWLVTGLATELKICFLVVLLRLLVVSSLNHTFTEWMLRFSEEAEDSRSLRPRVPCWARAMDVDRNIHEHFTG